MRKRQVKTRSDKNRGLRAWRQAPLGVPGFARFPVNASSARIIRNPEAVQLVADETRRKIIFLLRIREMNVSQIAKELNLTPQAVYHHIRRLVNCQLIEVVR